MNRLKPSKRFPTLTFPYRVFYADTDAGGVVYYAQYLRMFEQARGLYAEAVGLSLFDLAKAGTLFVCRRAEIDYRHPAMLDDRLAIQTTIDDWGKTFLTFTYTIRCDSRTTPEGEALSIAGGLTQMACVRQHGESITPQRIPPDVWQRLESGADSAKTEASN